MFEKLKANPRLQDQAVGLTILFTFCFLSYSIGFTNGKEAGRLEENPKAVAEAQAREDTMNKHLDLVIQTAIERGDRSCAALAAMLPK